MHDKTINTLETLIKSNQNIQSELGFAIKLLKYCKQHSISGNNKAIKLPDTSGAFGYFVIHECAETGESIKVVSDDNGNAVEVLPESVIFEMVGK